MATATIQGTGGDVTLPSGFTGKLGTWSAQIEVGSVDTSGFSDNGWQDNRPTIVGMSGSAGGTLITDTPALPTALMASSADLTAAKGTLVLQAATSTSTSSTNVCKYTMTAVISGVSISRPVDGKADVTFDFQSSGTITQAWT